MRSIIAKRWVARLLSLILLVAILVPALSGRQVVWAATPVPEEFFKAPEVKEFLKGFYLSEDKLRPVLSMEDPDHPEHLPVWVQVQTLLAEEAEYEEWKWALAPNQNGGTRTLSEALKKIDVILKGYEKVLNMAPKMLFPAAEAPDLVVGSIRWYAEWLLKLRSWKKDAEIAAGFLNLFKGPAINRNLNEIIWYCRDSDPEESDDQRQVVEMLAEGAGMSSELAVAFGHRVHVVLNSDVPGKLRALKNHIYKLARAQSFSISNPTVRTEGNDFIFSAVVATSASTYPVRLEVEVWRGVVSKTYLGEPVRQGLQPTVTVKGLSPGEYNWQVRALGSSEADTDWITPSGYQESHLLVRAAEQKRPAAPTLISATPRSDGERPGILLQWTPVPDALYYSIYRDNALIFTTRTAITTFWNISGLKPGVRYAYQVRAHMADSVSEFSKSVSVTAPSPGPASNAARVLVDGSLVPLDVAPVNVDGRLLVPMRAITEALGANVRWDQASQTATITLDGTVVEVTVGMPTAKVNGTVVHLAAAAQNIGGRVMVPLRFMGESFGADVGWNAKTSTVVVLGKRPDAGPDSNPPAIADPAGPAAGSARMPESSRISAGNGYTAVVKEDGTVWTWGYYNNSYGPQGGGTHISSTPVQVKDLTGVVAISTGVWYTFALKEDGTVWAWGYNNYGQLGDGTNENRNTPVQVKDLTGVVAVSSEEYHTAALKEDGTVWAWGVNGFGQLGDGTTENRSTPVQVKGLTGVVAISVGNRHTVALKEDGTVWAWGANQYGWLGDGTTEDRSTPVQVKGLTGVVAISSGFEHTAALREDGTVWVWGSNSGGALGTTGDSSIPVQVKGLNGVVTISARSNQTFALKEDGTVWAWGWNNDGQLGDGTTECRSTPVQVKGLTGVVDISAGWSHTAALKKDGTVWVWGQNDSGQLGDGTFDSSTIPVQALINLDTSATAPDTD